ncbi:MAG: DUF4396 domain-containing protein [Myxococcota bacterium]
MLDGVIALWFILSFLSVAFVAFDCITNSPVSWVQKLAWLLVTLYTGPVALFFYLLSCRRPVPGTHDLFTRATWKQALNSEMHCLAGDATGVLLAATLTTTLALSSGVDLVVEYVAGFVCGLFIFQALMMLPMYGGQYWTAVRKTFFAETVSMNFVMAGMFPVMLLMMSSIEGAMEASSPRFWFSMSMATLMGGVVAFPVNHWLVSSHLKHGCMTLPGADRPAPGLGHKSSEGDESADMSHAHAAHGHGMHGGGSDPGDSMPDSEDHESMEMGSIPRSRSALAVILSLALMLAATALTSLAAPIRF